MRTLVLAGRDAPFEDEALTVIVGGVWYFTTLATVRQHGSIFNQVAPSEDGCIAVDRDPALFAHILAYLRSGYLTLDREDGVHNKLLLLESRFYGLTPLTEYLEAEISAE